MSLRLAFSLAFSLTLIPAAAAASPDRPEPARAPTVKDMQGPRGYLLTPPDAYVAEGGSQISKILFVNRCAGGCTISNGGNNSIENTSSIVDGISNLSEFMHSQQVWDDTIACVREVYAPYDVEVVTEDPGEVFHHEAILAGTVSQIGGNDPNVLGVAPFASDCSARNNVISFSFANAHPPDWVHMCHTVAQESAHAFGLDHAFDCADPMTYILNCGQKFFRDANLPCGEFSSRPCQCSGNTQNSHRKLTTVFGEGTLPPPPTVSVLLPEDGGSVMSRFPVYAEAQHKRGIGKVEFYFNGWLWGSAEGNDFSPDTDNFPYTTPADLPDGVIEIEARAFNDLGIPASATVTVTKGAPCSSADQCSGGQLCEDGKCFWPAPTGQLGDACERDMDCVSLLCPANGDDRICSESCFVGISGTCPEGYDCLEAGNQGVCWPADGTGGGGCCSVGGEPRAPIAEGLIALALLGFVIRRRRV
jgi:MYXO-CTERM domain-containing protein